MQYDDDERYRKMGLLSQIGWWETDFVGKYFLCSDFLCDLLDLEGNTISFGDFYKMVHEDYRDQIMNEFASYAHKDFYERTFPIYAKNGVAWVRTRLGDRTDDPVTGERIRSFGTIQLVESPGQRHKETDSNNNDLLYRQESISQTLLRFLHDENIENCVESILNDILKHYKAERAYIFEYDKDHRHHYCKYEVVSSKEVTAEKDRLVFTSASDTPWWSSQILSGQPIILDNLTQLPEEAIFERKELGRQNINSLMAVPLSTGDYIWGYMGIDIVNGFRSWNNIDYQWLLSLANIVSICLELRKTKDDIIRDQEFLYNLFSHMPMGYIHLSVLYNEDGLPNDYKITDANQLCADWFGLPCESFIGKYASEIYSDPGDKIQFLSDILVNGGYRELDEYFKRTDMYFHWIIYSPSENEIVGLFINSTETMKAHKALDRSEKLFKNVFANIPVGVEIYNKDGNLTDLNNKDMDIFGIEKKSDVIGVNIFSNPNIPLEIQDRIKMDDMVDFNMTYMFPNVNGHYYPTCKQGGINLYTKVCKWYDMNDNFNGYVFINIDDTERINSSNRIRDFENLFSFISDYAKVGYCKLNLVNKEGYAIKQWYRNIGEDENKPLSEIVGIYDKVHPEDRERLIEYLNKALNGISSSFRDEIRVSRNDNSDEWNWLSMNVVITEYEPEKGLVELIGISYDITELKETEAKLVAARDKAEAMDRLKSAFLANMSHEIRTPLNAIVGFSNLLVDTEDIDERLKYIHIVQENNDLLLQLISDILDLSKIEAGTVEFVRENVDVNLLCEELVYSLQIKKPEGVELIFDPHLFHCHLTSDRNRLIQILTNFINNAFKFTLRGSICVGYEDHGEYVEFYVEDTGIGISKEEQSHIFDRFVKLNSFVNGTGLGLSICKTIVEQLGGTIGVDSEIGKGSRFWFTHPRKQIIEKEVYSGSHNFQKDIPAAEKGKPLVLIAEDTQSNFMLMSAILRKDYKIEWAHDGLEVVKMCRDLSPDLILMDIRMPHMNGLEATRKIREFDLSVPILAVTAFAFENDKKNALQAGCNGFIAKPIIVQTFKEQVKNALSGKLTN
ncbi:hybrid sensor histidine kinase/response regulator [Coprobacter tertius]|uniref:histidine kinase n=1 Tax=Coprobacter tertius TaxID=2944915 RepID=A0ABT1ME92_9BACT|nr:response regulator [Coprobacter tertius]MCP9610945.1 response regulator [Coprobacter tertius]